MFVAGDAVPVRHGDMGGRITGAGTRRTLRRSAAAAAVAALAVSPTPARGEPAMVPGWPVAAPAGPVFPGPAGGPVVLGPWLQNDQVPLVAFRGDGSRLWLAVDSPGCGNCEGPAETRLNADGSYGPIGFTGNHFWGVGRSGVVTGGCAGSILADGSCVSVANRVPAAPAFRILVRAERSGTTLWEHEEPDLAYDIEIPPRVLADESGVGYVKLGAEEDESGVSRLIALNPDGSLRFRLPGGGVPVDTFARGVLVRTATGIAAIDQDGRTRWSRAGPAEAAPGPPQLDVGWRSLRVDPALGQIYVQEDGRVAALDPQTGAELWRLAGRLIGVSRQGGPYLVGRGGTTLIATDGAGTVRWRYRTALPIAGVADQGPGRVAVSTRGTGGVRVQPGLIALLDTTRTAPRARRARVSLDRTTIDPRCRPRDADDADAYPTGTDCSIDGAKGAILQVVLPRPSRLLVTFREPDGRATPGLRSRRVTVAAPAGTSHLRLLAGENGLRAGRHVVVVAFREAGRAQVVRIPVRTTGGPSAARPAGDGAKRCSSGMQRGEASTAITAHDGEVWIGLGDRQGTLFADTLARLDATTGASVGPALRLPAEPLDLAWGPGRPGSLDR